MTDLPCYYLLRDESSQNPIAHSESYENLRTYAVGGGGPEWVIRKRIKTGGFRMLELPIVKRFSHAKT